MNQLPSREAILRSVTRGRHAVLETADVAAVRAMLAQDDLHVFVSGHATVTVMRLVGEDEAERVRPELDRLIADFRRLARDLATDPATDADTDDPDADDWFADPHGEHCRFEHVESGLVVEVNLERPDELDPGFLLLFAQTSRRYPGVLAACVHGFHDMARLLELSRPGCPGP
jgi:hypothetical protein